MPQYRYNCLEGGACPQDHGNRALHAGICCRVVVVVVVVLGVLVASYDCADVMMSLVVVLVGLLVLSSSKVCYHGVLAFVVKYLF